MLGDVAPMLPIQAQHASKSNVSATRTSLSACRGIEISHLTIFSLTGPFRGNLHEIHRASPAILLGGGELIADAAPVGLVVAAHEAALVLEAVFEQQRDGDGAVVPGGGPISGRPHLYDLVEGVEALLHHLPL